MKIQQSDISLRRERSVSSQNQMGRIAIVMILLFCAFAPSRAQIPITNTGTIILSDTVELINDLSLLDSIKPIGPPWYTVNALGSKCTKQTLKRIKKPKEKAADKQYLLYY